MKTNMCYECASNWIVKESAFDEGLLGKSESVMCLGNGYLGIRSATEERYLNETRNCFVAGTFNKADQTEVTELPNTADVLGVDIWLGEEHFSLVTGKIVHYEKFIDLKKGVLTRNVKWISPGGYQYQLSFMRFVSLDQLHVIGQKICVVSLDQPVVVKVKAGIDATMTNSGAQHFEETQKRLYEKRYLQYVQTTVESKIQFVFNTCVNFFVEAGKRSVDAVIGMKRRQVFGTYEVKVGQQEELVIEKLSNVYTTRDLDYRPQPLSELQQDSLDHMRALEQTGYDQLLQASVEKWKDYWSRVSIEIDATEPMDQLAIRFAQYHLRIMTPIHDNRMNIAAKGLSGESYRGHTFWDTEIFMLPYYIFQYPEVARKLIGYRYQGLEGARKKAAQNGYRGAQYPWETAWVDDGEVTPAFGDADIVTGMPQKIWTGQIEQHITADVIYGVYQYYMATGDMVFMENCGYEMIFETAAFWVSRVEDGEDGRGHINDVIGPDEYKEHVDDNAYTNYMAYWNIEKAVYFYEELLKKNTFLWNRLNDKLNIEDQYPAWKLQKQRLYLPQARKDGVMPQDATYLSLKEIDLEKYKEQDFVLGIYQDYNAEQLNGIQVSKQADILLLFYLLENYFTQEVKMANWNYYEPKTLHDSNLSLSTHCVLANDIGNKEMAYELFEKLCAIDLGPYMKSSDAGIHGGSLGGIWQSVVFGFAGVRVLEGNLRIRPNLPATWKQVKFQIYWKNIPLKICIERHSITILNVTKKEIREPIEVCGLKYNIADQIVVKY